ncbi:MAG: PAM68 family protein [Elainellaceae cyanobacterium]
MASKSKSGSPESDNQNRLPFEPNQNRKKPGKPDQKAAVQSAGGKQESSKPSNRSNRNGRRADSGIPEAVSQRMVRRMVLFCGIPTLLGISTFLVSYQIVSRELLELPHSAVLLVSLGFFGLGVLGLSYGAMSASWDEDRRGGFLGLSEFRTNFQRMRQAWQSEKNGS